MTDQGPGYLPGRPIGFGLTPGVHHNVMTMRDDMTGDPEAAPPPVSATPGAVPEEKIDLDAPDAAPVPAAPMREAIGWRIKHPDGSVLAEFHNVNTQDYQKEQIKRIGQSLVDQAVTAEDKEAANRALAYGMAMAGVVPVGEIGKRMAMRYDTDQRNSISRDIQEQKNKRWALRLGGGGGAAGPTKADKFENQVDLDDAKLTEGIVNNEQAQAKMNNLRDYETDLSKIKAQIGSGTALSQRAAIAEYIKTLTGKQATDRERDQILGAAGLIAKWENNLALWDPKDASLSKAYVAEFKANLASLEGAVKARKQALGKEFSDRLTHQPRFAKKDEDTKKALGKYGYGVATGDYGDAPQPAPAGVDPDLVK